MIAPEVAWDKLTNFQTADELRDYFKSENVKGIIGHAQNCPIATWLRKTTGHRLVTVAGQIKFIGYNNIIAFEHTKATEDFISKFDHEDYPELISSEEGKWK